MTSKLDDIDRLMLRFDENELDSINCELRDDPEWKFVAIGLLNHLSRNVRRELIESWGLKELLEKEAGSFFNYAFERVKKDWEAAAVANQ